MAANFNKVILAGNLTRDPQVRFLANERAVAEFGLAVNRKYRGGDGEMKEETTFVDIECWSRTAELVGQYLTKGRSCLIDGRLKLDSWEDRDGNKRNRLRVVADVVQFLDGRGGSGGSGASGGGASSPDRERDDGDMPPRSDGPAASADVDDEPPF